MSSDIVSINKKYDRIMLIITLIITICSFILGYNMGADSKTDIKLNQIKRCQYLYNYYYSMGYSHE